MSKNFSLAALALVGLLAVTIYGNLSPIGSQTPASGFNLGVEYVSNRLMASATDSLGSRPATGYIKGWTDTMKVAGSGADTSKPFPTHLGPYGLVMPSIMWSFKGVGNSVDSTAGVLALDASNEPVSSQGKRTSWHQIALLDSIYGGTTVTTELFQYIFLGGSATFTSNVSGGLHYTRFAALPPDTLAAYASARFRYRGRYANLSAGTDTLRVTVRPLLIYNSTATREYNKAR